jgi:hypothetical protein
MYHLENKIMNRCLILILVISFFYSCKNGKNEDELYKSISKTELGEKGYDSLYNSANDSIKSWVNARLKNYLKCENGYFLDSVFCINKTKTKVVYALSQQDFITKGANSDYMQHFYGVKIKEKWYFFQGATLVLPRENYQEDIHTPLSFEKLHELSMKHVFTGYLKHNNWLSRLFLGKDEYEINETFFKEIPCRNLSGEGFGSCLKCKTEDEYYLYMVNKNWQKRDTTFNKKENL